MRSVTRRERGQETGVSPSIVLCASVRLLLHFYKCTWALPTTRHPLYPWYDDTMMSRLQAYLYVCTCTSVCVTYISIHPKWQTFRHLYCQEGLNSNACALNACFEKKKLVFRPMTHLSLFTLSGRDCGASAIPPRRLHECMR